MHPDMNNTDKRVMSTSYNCGSVYKKLSKGYILSWLIGQHESSNQCKE